MKTTVAILEYLVPGILATASLLVLCSALSEAPSEAVRTSVEKILSSKAFVQAGGALVTLSIAYALGALASSVGGQIAKRAAREAQREGLESYRERLLDEGVTRLGGVSMACEVAAKDVPRLAGYLRAYCRIRNESVDRQLQFHTEQGRMLRALIVPAILAVLAAVGVWCRHGTAATGPCAVTIVAFILVAFSAFDAYVYRQKLLVFTSLEHVLALPTADKRAERKLKRRGLGAALQEDVVAVDWDDQNPQRMTFRRAHRTGVPHRAVHIEVRNDDGLLLVWRRADGRLEIPGGHLQWSHDQPEPPHEGAARELLEELGYEKAEIAQRCDVVASYLKEVAVELNRSHANRNVEWVRVFAATWADLGLALPDTRGPLSAEGNKAPRWLGMAELRVHATDPSRLNSALLMVLGRMGSRPTIATNDIEQPRVSAP